MSCFSPSPCRILQHLDCPGGGCWLADALMWRAVTLANRDQRLRRFASITALYAEPNHRWISSLNHLQAYLYLAANRNVKHTKCQWGSETPRHNARERKDLRTAEYIMSNSGGRWDSAANGIFIFVSSHGYWTSGRQKMPVSKFWKDLRNIRHHRDYTIRDCLCWGLRKSNDNYGRSLLERCSGRHCSRDIVL